MFEGFQRGPQLGTHDYRETPASRTAVHLRFFQSAFNIYFLVFHQTGKTTTIRRTAVREAGVSRGHGGSIEGLN